MTSVAPRDVARLVALAAIWGASFVFMRVAVPALGPVWTAALRVLIAGSVLVAVHAASGGPLRVREHARVYAVAGVLNSAIPFALYGYASLTLPASYMVVLNAATPMFAALLAPFWLGEPLTRVKAAGLALGVAGVALLSGAGPIAVDGPVLVAMAACLAAALCYAASGIWLKRRGEAVPPLPLAAWGQLFAGAALLPLALTQPWPVAWTAAVAANLLALALLSSAVAYLLYFRLIRDVGPTRTSTVTLLMPGFGVAWGALFLDERVTLPMTAGIVLVVLGVGAVFRPALASASAPPAGPSRLR